MMRFVDGDVVKYYGHEDDGDEDEEDDEEEDEEDDEEEDNEEMMMKMWRAYRNGALERKIENENVYEEIKIIWWEG